MNSSNRPPKETRRACLLIVFALQCGAVIGFTSCGKSGNGANGGSSSAPGGEAHPPTAGAHPGTATARAEPELPPLDHPASPSEAARYVDLSVLPACDGADQPQGRTVANLSYRVASKVKAVYEFHQKQFLAQKWKELPEGKAVTDDYASSVFERAGFHVSLMVSPSGDAGKVDVMLHNHGNVDLAKLPLPASTKKVYAGPITIMHVTEAPVAATSAECRKLVLAHGWEPYGSAGDSVYFRRNGVQLQINVMSAPAQGGNTMITYSSEQMSADIPAPAEADDVRYADTQRRLSFLMAGDANAVARSYKDAAMKSGWKPNREEIFRQDDKDVMVFRNSAGDMIWMDIKAAGAQSNVTLKYQSGAEIAAMDAKMDTQAAAYKAKMKADLEKPVLTLELPPGATVVSKTPHEFKLTFASGHAETTADAWNDKLHDTGWQLSSGTRQGGIGSMALRREGQTLTIDFDDAGSPPAVTVTATGVEVEVQ